MNKEAEAKFSKDGPFSEPCVKCDACQALLLVSDLRKVGMCGHCGNTRVRNVRAMNDQDMATARKWSNEGRIDPDWLELFEASPEHPHE